MDVAKWIRDIPDFPKPGIIFKDITPLLSDPGAFAQCIDEFAGGLSGFAANKIVAAEARGFIFGGALAYKMGIGFVPVRKPGKLPGETLEVTYDLEYGTDTICMHADAVKAGDRVLLLDDVLATGGTAAAMIDLVRKAGAQVVGSAFLLELDFLNGREKLGECKVFSLLHVDGD